MKKKVLGAEEALKGGVARVIIADGRIQNPISNALSGNGTVAVCVREADSGPGIRIVAWQSGELSEVVTRADGPFSTVRELTSASPDAGEALVTAKRRSDQPIGIKSVMTLFFLLAMARDGHVHQTEHRRPSGCNPSNP
jgi:hypothetical protein